VSTVTKIKATIKLRYKPAATETDACIGFILHPKPVMFKALSVYDVCDV